MDQCIRSRAARAPGCLVAASLALALSACAPPPPDARDAPDARVALEADGAAPQDDAAVTPRGDDGAGDALLDAPPRDDARAPADVAVLAPRVEPARPCADTEAAVYAPAAGLGAFDPAQRGRIERCHTDPALDREAVQRAMMEAGVAGVTATSGAAIYRVAYRTQRGNGAAGLGTARVYLPSPAPRGPVPLVVVAHPSEGLANDCAPSRRPDALRDLALPWAARGLAVIAPDYAGLGNGGVQGYLDNRDTAYSVLDAARALRALTAPGALADRVLYVGYSQGGGAVLSVQALARSYGRAGDQLVGVAAIAPQWPARLDSFRRVTALRDPSALTITHGITTPPVVALSTFAYFDAYVGAGRGPEAFPPATRAAMTAAVQSLCLIAFGGAQQALQVRVGDWLDPPLRQSLLACVDAPTSAGCVPPGRGLYEALQRNLLTSDRDGAPVLFVQGLADVVLPPAREAACLLPRLAADGVDVQLCTDATATHASVLGRNIGFVVRWGEARLAGAAVPACSAAGMPACAP